MSIKQYLEPINATTRSVPKSQLTEVKEETAGSIRVYSDTPETVHVQFRIPTDKTVRIAGASFNKEQLIGLRDALTQHLRKFD